MAGSNGLIRPNETITRAEAVTMMLAPSRTFRTRLTSEALSRMRDFSQPEERPLVRHPWWVKTRLTPKYELRPEEYRRYAVGVHRLLHELRRVNTGTLQGPAGPVKRTRKSLADPGNGVVSPKIGEGVSRMPACEMTEADRAKAKMCESCPVCRQARAKQRGLAFWFVENVEGGICPACKAYEKVHGQPAHAPWKGGPRNDG